MGTIATCRACLPDAVQAALVLVVSSEAVGQNTKAASSPCNQLHTHANKVPML